MNKWFKGLTLISILMLEVQADSGWTLPALQPPPDQPTINFPLNPDQGWIVKPSLLVWRPNQQDTDIGFSNVIDADDSTTKQRVKELNFSWSTGVRLGLGRYLPNHQQWDVTLNTTYFYNQSSSNAKGGLAPVKTIQIGWNTELMPNSIESHYGFNINYFTWDLSVGREFSLTRTVVLHPFVGLRAGLIYENYYTRNQSVVFTPAPVVTGTKFKASNDFWGIGPRVGTDFSFYFGTGWSIIGNLSGSFLYSRYDIKETIDGAFLPVQAVKTIPVNVRIKDHDALLATNLDAAFGLGYEAWVRNHTVRIAPSFLFEITKWYGFNHWIATDFSTSTVAPVPFIMDSTRRKDGDLGFLGFSVNLQIDF
jgi:hypothetical protein